MATNGLPVSDALIVESIRRSQAARVPWLANRCSQPLSRWFTERLFGLGKSTITLFARQTFPPRRRATVDEAQPHGGLKVVYFVDLYANYHDPDIGKALAEVLQQNGIGLYVPTSQAASGMARLTSGDIKGARKIARKNVRLLADAVRQGYSVIATEPAAVLCLKHEYPNLLDDEDAHLVAEHHLRHANSFICMRVTGWHSILNPSIQVLRIISLVISACLIPSGLVRNSWI